MYYVLVVFGLSVFTSLVACPVNQEDLAVYTPLPLSSRIPAEQRAIEIAAREKDPLSFYTQYHQNLMLEDIVSQWFPHSDHYIPYERFVAIVTPFLLSEASQTPFQKGWKAIYDGWYELRDKNKKIASHRRQQPDVEAMHQRCFVTKILEQYQSYHAIDSTVRPVRQNSAQAQVQQAYVLKNLGISKFHRQFLEAGAPDVFDTVQIYKESVNRPGQKHMPCPCSDSHP